MSARTRKFGNCRFVGGCGSARYARGLCKRHLKRAHPNVYRRMMARRNERQAARDRERYRSDPAYRDARQTEARRRQRRKMADPINREARNARERKRYAENGDAMRAAQRERYATDPEYRKRCIERATRRGYRSHLPGLLREQRWRCALCGGRIRQIDSTVHVDHIIPQSKGGTDDRENLQAVHGRCNSAKGNR